MGFSAELLRIAVCVHLASGLRRKSSQMRSDDLQPANFSTGQNCMCRDVCGASLAEHHRCDWCITSGNCGDWAITRGHYDFCKYETANSFTSLRHDAKMKTLWEKITSDTSVQPFLSKVNTLLEVVTMSMISTMDNTMEVLPAGRQKVIHQQGVVLQFDLVIDGASPYSGMLSPGAHRGLMRLGSAFRPKEDNFPGIAVKFLRSGIHSANTVLLRGNGNGTGQLQFFEEPLSNHVSPPSALELLNKFNQASGCRAMTGLSDLCRYSQDGSQVRSLNFPYEIQVDAPNRAQFPIDTSAGDADAEVLRALSTIPKATHLYDVYAKASPSAKLVRIGKVVTTSAPTTSWFGDTQLSFRHQRMEEDFMEHPEWIQAASDDKEFCDASADKNGNLRSISDWQCPGVVGVPPP